MAIHYLKLGVAGENVRTWQGHLGRAGFPVVVDGLFGPKTADATRRFQRRERITVDGVVGPQAVQAFRKLFPHIASGIDFSGTVIKNYTFSQYKALTGGVARTTPTPRPQTPQVLPEERRAVAPRKAGAGLLVIAAGAIGAWLAFK